MPSLPYSPNIPNAPNDPADDQPLMQQNFSSINLWTSVDHFEFSDIKAGIHKQVTLKNEAAPGLGAGDGVLFANTASGQSWPFWQNGAAGSPFQLLGNASTIASNGFTTLPNGIIFQWGLSLSGGGTVVVTFPTPFPNNVFSFTATMIRNSTNKDVIYVKTVPPGPPPIATINCIDTSSGNSFYWFAVGN